MGTIVEGTILVYPGLIVQKTGQLIEVKFAPHIKVMAEEIEGEETSVVRFYLPLNMQIVRIDKGE